MIPEIDVIVVARNEGETFVKCCASVAREAAAFKAATGLEAAVTYVDSWSDDGSVDVAKRHGFRIARPPKSYYNCANGRTTGLLLTSAEFVMILDGDMELSPGWLAAGRAFLKERPAAGGVAGVRDDMRLSGAGYVRIPNYFGIKAKVQGVGGDVGGAFLFRRDALMSLGGFEPGVVPEEDFIVGAQLAAKGRPLYRIDAPMITHWDTKISSPAAIVRHLMFSRKALVPGVIFRYALLHAAWWPQLLRFKTDLLVHAAWLALLLVPAARLPATAAYLALIWTQKRGLLRTAAAPLLRTVYLANFLAGFLTGYPKLEFGLQHDEKYKAEVRELNA